MVAQQHSTSTAMDTTMWHTAKGAVGGGFMGAVTGFLTGAAIGALALAVPALIVAGVAAAGGAILGGTGLVAGGAGAVAGTAALIGGGVVAGYGGLTGGLSGAAIGGGAGAGFFGTRGALHGADVVARDNEQYKQSKIDLIQARQNAIGAARSDAAEYYTALGYQQGFQEGNQVGQEQGANMVVNQIIAAHEQQQKVGGHSFAEKVADHKKPHHSHADSVRHSQEMAAQQEPGGPTA